MGVPRTLAKGLSKLKEAAELRKLKGVQALRLYHGTNVADDFSAFVPSRGIMGTGVYGTPDTHAASTYAAGDVIGKQRGTAQRVIPVDANLQNVFDFDNATKADEIRILEANGLSADEVRAIPDEQYLFDRSYLFDDVFGGADPADILGKAGYDGATAREMFNRGGVPTGETYQSYVAYDPKKLSFALSGSADTAKLGGTQAERMARAAEQGWNVADTYTHSGGDIKTINKGGLFDGIFASQGDESLHGFGDVDTTMIMRRPVAGRGDFDLDYDQAIKTIKSEYPSATDDEVDAIYELAARDKNIFDADINPFESRGFSDLGEASWEAQRIRGRIAADQGFDAIAMSDEHGTSYLVPSGSQARSINADFNPANRESSNLLASVAGAVPYVAAGLGGAAALAPEQAQASPVKVFSHLDDAGRAVYKTVIEAWHGTPHTFPAERLIRWADGRTEHIVGGVDALPDVPAGAELVQDFPLGRFRMDKIGTGEGAQAYGHGAYFADAKATGVQYRDDLTQYKITLDGIPINPVRSGKSALMEQFPGITEADAQALNGVISDIYSDPRRRGIAGARKDAAMMKDFYRNGLDKVEPKNRDAALAMIAAQDEQMRVLTQYADRLSDAKGSLYRTEIDVDPSTLLDWDKPLSEQPEQVKSFIEPFRQRRLAVMNQRPGIYTSPPETIVEKMTGGEWLDEITGQIAATSSDPTAIGRGAQSHTSKVLRESGIPGIRYLDGMSRNAGEGSYNYVMFDDKPISIVERGNATPALLAATAAGTGAGIAAADAFSAQPDPSYDAYIRDAMEARTAAESFAQMRGSKAGYWEARRQELLDMVSTLGDAVLQQPTIQATQVMWGMHGDQAMRDADRPLRAALAGAGALANVATGENLSTVGQNAQQVWNQDSLETTGNLGDQAADWIMRQGSSASPNPLQEGAAELARFGLKWIPQVASPI
jgi:hypothetical protein